MKSRSRLLLLAALFYLIVFPRLNNSFTAHGQPGYSGGQTLTCSSNDGKRNYCNVDTRGGIRLTRQISGSPCTQGQTWGFDNRGVWVDRGCRAEFVTGSGGGGNWGPGGGGQGQTLTCSSDDGRRNYCNVDTRGGVRLTRQISGSPCSQGQTWGFDNRGVWVDRGCRAEFVIGAGGGGNWNPGNSQPQTITCSSDDGRRNYCNVDTRGGVRLTRQISGSPCTQGQTWGFDNRGVWVDRGCRAQFVTGAGGNWRPEGPGNQYQTITCSSDNGKRNFCSLPSNVNPNSVVLTRQISGSPCNRGDTWGIDRNNIWVDRGCRAEFGIR